MTATFGLDTEPKKCAELHCDQHTNKMIVEAVQLAYQALRWNGIHVSGPPEVGGVAYRPPGQVLHPNCLWPAGAQPHLLWMLRQALHLGTHVRPQRFPNSKKSEHASVPHLRWLLRILTEDGHCGYDLSSMQSDAPTPDEFLETVRGFLSGPEFKRLYPNREPLSSEEIDARVEKMRGRIATHDAPDGCNFGILALNSSEPTDPEFQRLVVRVSDAPNAAISWTRTYQRYYVHKAKHAFLMTWAGSLTPPDEFKSAFASFEPDVPVIVSALPKKPKEPKEPKEPKKPKSSSGSTTGKRKSAEAA